MFSYTNNEISEKEIEKPIPLIIASKTKQNKKYLGINLTKKVKDLYNKNYKTLMKEIEEVTNIWKNIIFCVHGLEELILLKYPYYPKPSIDSMQSLSKYQWHFS